jgi:transcriptional regulator with XRE-family HTH domain
MAKPQPGISPVVQTLAEQARRQGLTAYAIAKARDMHVSTVQKALDGEVSPSIATLEEIAAAVGATITVNVPADVPPTGSTRPDRPGRSPALRSTEETPSGSGALTRKRKSSGSTFLPGELEPVTTDAVTKKRRPTP